MKKLLSIILAILMIVTTVPFAFAADTVASGDCGANGDNVTWVLDSEGTLTISGTGAMENYESWRKYDWHSDSDAVKSVVIEDGVTTVGIYAFYYCKNLTSVTLPDSVKSICNRAFFGCSGLTEITLPDSVTSIDEFAFVRCTSLTEITFSDNVTSIGEGAFSSCSSLTEITLPDSVTSIGASAFRNCEKLESITLSENVENIGNRAFMQCPNLATVNIDPDNEHFKFVDGVLFSKDGTVLISYLSVNQDDMYTIPNGVTKIDSYAFNANRTLVSVTIPDSVTAIGYGAFLDCIYLTSITIPTSVTVIEGESFAFCEKLTSVIIPDSVTSIGNAAFYGCQSLTSVMIPDSVTSIDASAFCHCDSLESVIISGSVTSIGYGAFDWNFRLASAHYLGLSDNVTISENNSHLTDVLHYCEEKAGVPATCTEDGIEAGWYCEECDKYVVGGEAIPATNHKDTLVQVDAKAPTCTEIGWDAYEYCTECDYTTYAEKSALDHDIIVDAYAAPTCTQTGLTEGQHCSRCDDETVAQEVIPDRGSHVNEDGNTLCDHCGETILCENCRRPVHEDTFARNLICLIVMFINLIKTAF